MTRVSKSSVNLTVTTWCKTMLLSLPSESLLNRPELELHREPETEEFVKSLSVLLAQTPHLRTQNHIESFKELLKSDACS